MKLLFFISSLQSGGAERVASILLDRWRRDGHEIVAAEWSLKDPFYPLDPGIRLLRLGLNASAGPPRRRGASAFGKFMALKKTISEVRPDLVVSFMTRQNIYSILAARAAGVPVIASEHNHRRAEIVGLGLDAARLIFYPLADRVTLLTERDRQNYPRLRNAVVMPNPLDLPEPSPRKALRSRTVLAVGRLHRQKGFDLLIEAFSRIPDRRGFALKIAGEGEERPRLEALIHRCGLEDEVVLLGRRSDVYSLYEDAAFLVLPSRYEGFGMVLVEAMAFGCPVVAFDCPCGPAEIVRDGVDGILVPSGDLGALAAAIERMIADDALRERLGEAGPEVRERFGIDQIAAKWEALFGEVLAMRKGGVSA